MKMIIEDSDVKEVKSTLKDWYGVGLTDAQAKALLEGNNGLVAELYECGGHLDTQGRQHLGRVMVGWLTKDVPRPKHNNVWEWPKYGSSPEYEQEFYEIFAKAAEAAGVPHQ